MHQPEPDLTALLSYPAADSDDYDGSDLRHSSGHEREQVEGGT